MRTRNLTLGCLLVALCGVPTAVAEDLVLVTGIGIAQPADVEPGAALSAGSRLALEPWGWAVLREAGGCGLTQVIVGQEDHELTATEDCSTAEDFMQVAARIQNGERFVARVEENGPGTGSELVAFLAGNPCAFLPAVSEEEGRNVGECPSGYALRGVRCRGQHCDDKGLLCCPYLDGASDPSAKVGGAVAISEEFPHSMSTKKFLAGLGCQGPYCDNVEPRTLKTDRLGPAKGCDWTGWASEQPGVWLTCGEGKLANGIRCQGDYCADVALSCCDVKRE